MRSLWILAVTMTTGASVLAQAQHAAPAAPSQAPAEATQFDFLVGQWDLEVTPAASGLAAKLHGAPKLKGTWSAHRAFNGWGIQDEIRILDNSGNVLSMGAATRVFDATALRWLVVNVDPMRARVTQATGVRTNDELVLTGAGKDQEGKPIVTRTRFTQISANGFRMVQDRSSDEGKTWSDPTLTVVAKKGAAKR